MHLGVIEPILEFAHVPCNENVGSLPDVSYSDAEDLVLSCFWLISLLAGCQAPSPLYVCVSLSSSPSPLQTPFPKVSKVALEICECPLHVTQSPQHNGTSQPNTPCQRSLLSPRQPQEAHQQIAIQDTTWARRRRCVSRAPQRRWHLCSTPSAIQVILSIMRVTTFSSWTFMNSTLDRSAYDALSDQTVTAVLGVRTR